MHTLSNAFCGSSNKVSSIVSRQASSNSIAGSIRTALENSWQYRTRNVRGLAGDTGDIWRKESEGSALMEGLMEGELDSELLVLGVQCEARAGLWNGLPG
jgi:hypothetical protein